MMDSNGVDEEDLRFNYKDCFFILIVYLNG
jgi:hypothetical protein